MANGQPDANINQMGRAMSPALSYTACQLWEWCLEKGVILSAKYLPGSHNMTAGWESRTRQSSTEWKLDKLVFLAMMDQYSVDLFTSRLP